eukprot:CAMPEP_0202972410 /NCGR_PEP_ID=MMETSP1396-20130829/36352_1 /ASSEMBLY_ACC=CAM_ASM_000872 /TAXON_ID= /ORGANISM="Pseudokeronopsis sp., Strain Brazil" /LENGTH=61 /DNA_ID=CAMNT_0049702793 /DNA_START=319 /DNA_END=504 /DNA_ORIENTATION=-
MHYAVESRNKEAVKMLIEAGFQKMLNVYVEDEGGKTPVDESVGQQQIQTELKKYDENWSPR